MTIRPEKREETPQREESPKATVTHVIRVSASGEAHVTAEGQVTSRPSSDYDTDILLWSERQAGLLRRRASGEPVEDAELDWPNIAEEIEDVGRSEFHAVESLLVQAFCHRLKAEGWPESLDVPAWQADAINFLRQARRRFVPSLRQKIDIHSLYDDALASTPLTMGGRERKSLPLGCPFSSLDELLRSC